MNIVTKNLVLAISIISLGSAMAGDNPTPTPTAEAASTIAGGPKIQFATPTYDAGKVTAGTLIKYTFAFTNTGTEMLEVTAVQPQCGCTTAGDWTHKVAPGQTGSIPVQVNSANMNGTMTKNVTVTCNDKTQPSTVVHLMFTIWKAGTRRPLM